MGQCFPNRNGIAPVALAVTHAVGGALKVKFCVIAIADDFANFNVQGNDCLDFFAPLREEVVTDCKNNWFLERVDMPAVICRQQIDAVGTFIDDIGVLVRAGYDVEHFRIPFG